jgi:molybdopterin molybdotransferase
MKEFFHVADIEAVLALAESFPVVGKELVSLQDSPGRVLGENLVSDIDLPGFDRSTMDGFAVCAASTFGASEGSPAFLNVKGSIAMGQTVDFSIGPGETARISTGGMMPQGSDAVVMVEYTEPVDENTIEVYKSAAPGQHVILKGEDFKRSETVLQSGTRLRAQQVGLLAAFGMDPVPVFKKPIIGVISTGDEIVDIHRVPNQGQIRDINTYSLSAQVIESGGIPKCFGIVGDHFETLLKTCSEALGSCDMVLVSGGSSVGMRDFTVEVLSNLPNAEILVHGISISPGKPTILANIDNKPFWGLPGHVVSAMVVFTAVVNPFVKRLGGLRTDEKSLFYNARLTRNISSAQGRTDYVRVRLFEKDDGLWAEPLLGKSGLIHTMVMADGLVSIHKNTEGLDQNDEIKVIPV